MEQIGLRLGFGSQERTVNFSNENQGFVTKLKIFGTLAHPLLWDLGMKRLRLTPCILLCLAVTAQPLMAVGVSPGVPLAVVPIHDGVSDSTADELQKSIAEALARQPGIHVVVQDRVAEVMAYQEPSATAAGHDVALAHALTLQERAKEHYLNFASAEAQAEIQSALTSIRNAPLSLSDKGLALRDALVTAAVIAVDTQSRDAAQKFLEEALHLDPQYTLNEKGFSPKLRDLVTAMRSRVATSATGTLNVTSDPKVADVVVNGVGKGVAPLSLQLPVGTYEVRVSGNRYAPHDQRVEIRGGETATVSARLNWRTNTPKPSPSSVAAGEAQTLIQKGNDLITLLRLQKVVLLDVDAETAGGGEIRARMIDATTKASHRPVVVRFTPDRASLSKDVTEMVRLLSAQATMKRIDNPVAQLDPAGVGDPIVLGRRKGRTITPLGWGVIGGIAGSGVIAGILAAVLSGSGGGGAGPNSGTGSVHVQLSK